MREEDTFQHNFDVDVVQVDEFPDAVFRVKIIPDEGSETTHTVHVSEDSLQELAGGKVGAQDLVEATFEFLMQRESNEAIMQEFSLTDVEEYFPEYRGVLNKML